MAHSFLKYLGGKTQLLDELLPRVPRVFRHYHEVCVGGGALFFALAAEGRIPSVARLSDASSRLIRTYHVVQDNVEALIARLSTMPFEKDFYYATRALDMDAPGVTDLDVASWFIYLNKTAYNGMYRVNKSGGFNVPMGRYDKPTICDAENLRACASVLQSIQTEIYCMRFQESFEYVRSGDFVFIDPPYLPLSKTSDFTSYTPEKFKLADHGQLRDGILALKKRGAYVLHTNSSAPEIRELYSGPEFHVEEVTARRSVNSKADKRGAVVELVIT